MIPPNYGEPTNPYGVGVPARLQSGDRGTVLPLFGDAHVHLGLVDPEALPVGGIGRVLDLGWSLNEIDKWVSEGIPGLEIDYVGNFLSAPKGYPSDRSWAPADATMFVSDPQLAIQTQILFNVDAIKITLNAEAGPVHSDLILQELVEGALEQGRIPIIHAEGPGQALRAIHSSLVVLAHTPFTEVLDDDTIAYAAKHNYGWISTLDIHGYGNYGEAYEIACNNLTRFISAGGTVFYGTDLGNGPLPEGINVRELKSLLRCGLSAEQLIDSLTAWWDMKPMPIPPEPEPRVSFISDISDTNTEDVCTWLALARIVETTEVEYL